MNLENIKNSKVLIVDDNSENLGVLFNILSNYGFELMMAQTGHDAFEIIDTKLPDLILLDIQLPDINGYEICRILKEKEESHEIPILFISVLSDVEDKIKAFKAGALDYITKPFNEEEVLARVITHLTIQQQKAQLIELNTKKNTIFSIISHDLKGPITSLFQLSKMLLNQYKSMQEIKLDELLNVVSETITNLHTMMENLLDWSIFQTGKIDENFCSINIYELGQFIISLYSQPAKLKNITLINNIDTNTMVYARENMIKTVLRNLVSNAIKFSYPDSQIIISSDDKKDSVQISVKDTGKGIDDKRKELLFKIGKPVVSWGTLGEKGSGLGLLLCKDFVESNNGHISIRSIEKVGTTVSFTLKKPPSEEFN